MKKNKKLDGVHGIQSVSVLANIVPSVWPAWLNVMLACCVDSNLKKKKTLCQLNGARLFFSFFFLLRKEKKKDIWRNVSLNGSFVVVLVVSNALFF